MGSRVRAIRRGLPPAAKPLNARVTLPGNPGEAQYSFRLDPAPPPGVYSFDELSITLNGVRSPGLCEVLRG